MEKLHFTDTEVLEGLALAHPELISYENNMVLSRALADAARVTVVAMSCSGHEPALAGFVGPGLADIAVVGNSEAAPGPSLVLQALQLADKGQGSLLVVLNNAGDILTSNIVLHQAELQGLQVARVIVHDDKTAAAETEWQQGCLGVLPVLKLAGAAAARGMSLAEVLSVAEGCAEHEASVKLTFIPETTAESLSAVGLEPLLEALQPQEQDELLFLVNGNGSLSSRAQLALLYNCHAKLLQRGFAVRSCAAADFFTGQEDAYAQLCLVRLSLEEAELWEASCRSAYFNK